MPLTDPGPAPQAERRADGDGGALADSERKLVTVLFADVVGFTTLAEMTDPEELRDLVNGLFGRLVPCIERYGGTVDKFIGDEVMALFGAPAVHEEDAERAVRAALAMRAAVGSFNHEWDINLAIHIGINSGRVLAGSVGVQNQSAYSVMGDPVNVAARLTQTAASGSILIGPDTWRRAGHLFEVVEAGAVNVKGRVAPVVAYRVIGERRGQGRQRSGQGRRLDSPLVGRDAECALFGAILDRLEAGEGGVVTSVGEAGLGKSRLVAEVRRGAAPRALTWLEGRASAFGESMSYGPFLEILRTDAGITEDDDTAAGVAKLAERVEVLFPGEVDEALPYLATLLSLPVPGELAERVRHVDGEAMRRQIVRCVRGYVAGLAAEQPLVLVFEDVHWLDDSSVTMIGQLLPLARELPVVFCLAGRLDPESATDKLLDLGHRVGGDRHAELVLLPLPVAGVHELVANLIGAHDPALGLERLVETRAEGNPLFVEEVIRALIDLGGLEPRDDGRWRATAGVADISLPGTIESIITARVDKLADSPKHVLKLASVIGRIFSHRVLAAVGQGIERLDDDLGDLQAVELIRERRPHPEKEYAFQHALVQEATYESVLVRQRKRLHLYVAEAVEALYADRLEEFSSRLAYHYTKAEAWDKAREYLLRAGDQALVVAADAEAIAHLERALEAQSALSRSRPDLASKIDPLERAALRRKVATLRDKQRRIVDSLAAIEEAEAELEQGRQETAEWWVEWIGVELEKAYALYFSRAGAALLDLLDTLEPNVERWGTPLQKGQYLFRVAAASLMRERHRPSPRTLDCVRTALELGVGSHRDEWLSFSGYCLLWADHLDEAGEAMAEALVLAEEADDLTWQASVLAYMAFLERRRGNAARAEELASRCLAAAREGAVSLYAGVAQANLAWVHWHGGDGLAAEREARDSLVYLTNQSMYPFTWLARWPLIGVLLERGEVSEAVEHAAAMIAPSQQELPPELTQALSASVDAWEESGSDDACAGLLAAHRLAESLGYA